MHLFDFVIRIYQDARSLELHILKVCNIYYHALYKNVVNLDY